MSRPATLGELRASGWVSRPIKDELRANAIRVLDLADNAVAYASRLLADLGAEVIRIEPPHGSALTPSQKDNPGPVEPGHPARQPGYRHTPALKSGPRTPPRDHSAPAINPR